MAAFVTVPALLMHALPPIDRNTTMQAIMLRFLFAVIKILRLDTKYKNIIYVNSHIKVIFLSYHY